MLYQRQRPKNQSQSESDERYFEQLRGCGEFKGPSKCDFEGETILLRWLAK